MLLGKRWPPLPRLKRRKAALCRRGVRDEIELRLNGLLVILKRELRFNWPHEVHIVVPRAEFIRTYQNGRLAEERTVLSSISIVHAPLHPPAEGEGPPVPPEIPPRCGNKNKYCRRDHSYLPPPGRVQ